MGETAVRLWKPEQILIDRGVFELEDAPVLLAYCNAFHLMLEAERVIAKDGMTVSSEMGGLKKHPAINVRNDSVSQLARLGSLLGLDPLSRIRMTSGGKDPDDKGNEFDEFD
jgi:P27 family predicted phage terminase small subunit